MTAIATQTIHEQLVEACEPAMEGFLDDLRKHDLDMLTQFPGRPFLHYTRRLGTHMFMLYRTEDLPASGQKVRFLFGHADRDHIAYQAVDCARMCARPSERDTHKLVHYFDGEKLKRIDVDEAEKIATEYYRRIRKEWSGNAE